MFNNISETRWNYSSILRLILLAIFNATNSVILGKKKKRVTTRNTVGDNTDLIEIPKLIVWYNLGKLLIDHSKLSLDSNSINSYWALPSNWEMQLIQCWILFCDQQNFRTIWEYMLFWKKNDQ